jgi:hypothetical protein
MVTSFYAMCHVWMAATICFAVVAHPSMGTTIYFGLMTSFHAMCHVRMATTICCAVVATFDVWLEMVICFLAAVMFHVVFVEIVGGFVGGCENGHVVVVVTAVDMMLAISSVFPAGVFSFVAKCDPGIHCGGIYPGAVQVPSSYDIVVCNLDIETSRIFHSQCDACAFSVIRRVETACCKCRNGCHLRLLTVVLSSGVLDF